MTHQPFSPNAPWAPTALQEGIAYVSGGFNIVVLLCWGLLVVVALAGTRVK